MKQTQIKATKRETLKLKEVNKAEYGDSLEKVEAEFQTIGLLSKGPNLIVQDNLKIGKKLNMSVFLIVLSQ